MSEIVKKVEKLDVSCPEKSIVRSIRTRRPKMFSEIDADLKNYNIEIHLPGISKDKIKLKLKENLIYVSGEGDSVKYVGYYTIRCPIDLEDAKATYKEGLLKIHAPLKVLLKDVKNIVIS